MTFKLHACLKNWLLMEVSRLPVERCSSFTCPVYRKPLSEVYKRRHKMLSIWERNYKERNGKNKTKSWHGLFPSPENLHKCLPWAVRCWLVVVEARIQSRNNRYDIWQGNVWLRQVFRCFRFSPDNDISPVPHTAMTCDRRDQPVWCHNLDPELGFHRWLHTVWIGVRTPGGRAV